MLERLDRYEAEYRRRLFGATAAAVALHTLSILLLGGWSTIAPPHDTAIERLHLGYPGPNRAQPELEVLEPNSVQAYFYQKAREGRARAVDYRLAPALDLSPGPRPIAVDRRQERRPSPGTAPQVEVDEPPDVLEPLAGYHAPLSFSEDFQILKLVKPVYPEYELSRGIRARVFVTVWVSPQGDLEMEQIREAYADPTSASTRGFELAVLEAVRQWKVRPPKRLAEFQGIWLTIPIQFDPEKDLFLDLEAAEPR